MSIKGNYFGHCFSRLEVHQSFSGRKDRYFEASHQPSLLRRTSLPAFKVQSPLISNLDLLITRTMSSWQFQTAHGRPLRGVQGCVSADIRASESRADAYWLTNFQAEDLSPTEMELRKLEDCAISNEASKKSVSLLQGQPVRACLDSSSMPFVADQDGVLLRLNYFQNGLLKSAAPSDRHHMAFSGSLDKYSSVDCGRTWTLERKGDVILTVPVDHTDHHIEMTQDKKEIFKGNAKWKLPIYHRLTSPIDDKEIRDLQMEFSDRSALDNVPTRTTVVMTGYEPNEDDVTAAPDEA